MAMTTIALDPQQTVVVELPGYTDRPAELRPRFTVRHFTCRTGLQLDRLLGEAASGIAEGRGRVEPLLAQALGLLIDDWHNLGLACPPDQAGRAEALLDLLTPDELAGLPGLVLQQLRMAESARKKSGGPSAGDAAPGAEPATA